jgi:hypothetical protein
VDASTTSFTDAYIDTVDISLGNSCITTGIDPVNPNAEKIRIIPNPAPGQFTLQVETLYPISNLNINILDMKGNTVVQFIKSKSTGIANFDLPVHNLPKGKYIVTVYNGNDLLASKKLIRL